MKVSRPRASSRRAPSRERLASEEIARRDDVPAGAHPGDARAGVSAVATFRSSLRPSSTRSTSGRSTAGSLETYRAWAAAHPPDEPARDDGESRAQAAARFARALRLVLARPEERVLVVGHALAIRYTVDAAAGLVPAARMAPVEHAAAVSPRSRRVGARCRAARGVERGAAVPGSLERRMSSLHARPTSN